MFWCIFLVCYLTAGVLNTLYLMRRLSAMRGPIEEMKKTHPNMFLPLSAFEIPKYELIFCGTFLFPFRFLLWVILLFMVTAFLKILLIVHKIKDMDFDRPLPEKYRAQSSFVYTKVARILFFVAGFYWIEKKRHHIKDLMPEYPLNQTSQYKRAPIIVSNHTNTWDVLYFMSTPNLPSFLAKSDVRKMPFIGTVAAAIQTIFVDRNDSNNKNSTVSQIQKRCEEFKKEKIVYPQMVIYPEGSTSDSQEMMTFKFGAFANNNPVKIYVFQYAGGSWIPCLNVFYEFEHLLICFSTFRLKMKVHELIEDFYPEYIIEAERKKGTEEKKLWIPVAETVRQIMNRMSGIGIPNLSLADKNLVEDAFIQLTRGKTQGSKSEKKTN